jgi:hypothetical protein
MDFVYNILKEGGGSLMDTSKAMEYGFISPQLSLCKICKERNRCFIDLEFYRLEQNYSLRGITLDCKRIPQIVPFRPVQNEDVCLACEKRDCIAAKKYKMIQSEKGLTRVITECEYRILYQQKDEKRSISPVKAFAE